jgi:hypothetical protein
LAKSRNVESTGGTPRLDYRNLNRAKAIPPMKNT